MPSRTSTELLPRLSSGERRSAGIVERATEPAGLGFEHRGLARSQKRTTMPQSYVAAKARRTPPLRETPTPRIGEGVISCSAGSKIAGSTLAREPPASATAGWGDDEIPGAANAIGGAATVPRRYASNRLGLRFWAERANREAVRSENGAVNALKVRSK